MSLLESIVLPNIMEVISSDNDGSLHLHLDDGTSKDASPDRNIACEWTLLVNVFSLDSLTWDFETKTDIPGISELLSGQLFLKI